MPSRQTRRTYLAGLAATALAGLAGCEAIQDGSPETGAGTPTGTPTTTATETPTETATETPTETEAETETGTGTPGEPQPQRSWPAFRFDAANTGTTDATGVTAGEVRARFGRRVGGRSESSPAVVDGVA